MAGNLLVLASLVVLLVAVVGYTLTYLLFLKKAGPNEVIVVIKKDESSLEAAAERFLEKHPAEIARVALAAIEGHLRGILGTLTAVDVDKNRDLFAQKVQGPQRAILRTWASRSTPLQYAKSASVPPGALKVRSELK